MGHLVTTVGKKERGKKYLKSMKYKKKRSHAPIDVYARLAREHGLTYGKLQALETLGKVAVINEKLYRVVGDEVEPYEKHT